MKRLWEIDFLRGTAIILMIIFHAILTLEYYGKFPGINSAIVLFGNSIGVIFLLLVGISLSISYSKNNFKKYLKRGLWIFFLGMLITIMSYLFNSQLTIWFGVLHLIGLSIIFSYIFLKQNKYANFLFGLIFIIRGFFLQKELFNFPWLLWLGLKPIGFATYDYFPIFPYFGLVLIGIGLGKTLYNKKKRNFKLINLEKKQVIKQFCFLGRHSLIIYLIHIPILLVILYFL